MNGLVNQADLFTKHLNLWDRINQLVELFNCKYREGRATAAPELGKNKTPAVDGRSRHAEIHLNDDARRRQADNNGLTATAHNDINEQSAMHDPDVLPHMYEQKDLEKIFQRAEAPDKLDCAYWEVHLQQARVRGLLPRDGA